MKRYLFTLAASLLAFALVFALVGAATADNDTPAAQPPDGDVVFHMDFSNAEVGDPPKELLILDGDFAVREVDGDKLLELPGKPLDSFGVLFGPRADDGLCVRARIRAEATRRRDPRFGVGLGGIAGFRLRVVPAREELEIAMQEKPLATIAYKWKSNTWTTLKLRLDKTGENEWLVRGKAWPSDEDEPADWTISYTTDKKPPPGQASIWGTPYSSKPIQFDDLTVQQPANEKAAATR